MLSLYEASYIGFHRESILDEALQFTKPYLKSIVNQLKPPLFDLVSHALRWPVHRAVPCQEALDYVLIYEKEEGHIDCILRMGKLNFSILQKLWQEELYILTRWWIDLNLPSRLSFGRDRLIECFFWAIGSFPEPQHARARKYLTQIYAIFVYVDDTYDVHGTIDELEIFTKAFERADSSMGGELPHYMHIIVQSTLDLYDEIAQETTKEQSAHCMAGAKEAVAQLAKAYNDEAKWFNDGYVPKLDEYLLVGSISCAYPMGVTVSTCGLGEMATKQVFDWLLSMPKILHASSAACRIRDDTRTHEFEQKRGDVASTVECYMNEHGVSEQEAIDFLERKMTCLWKDMNEELLKPSTRDIPLPLVDNIINHARVLEVVYEKEAGLTFPKNVLNSVVMDLVVNPLDV
ncbi:hypothetical protein K2173_023808 [Erythroxylum novogranatense]|uniref:Terpene synthase metal-binding domain-containing protein n=1 Tax=Erythroxylum novogranatense TaxID=1862640 RepID=A0AAV8TJG5_9ROSI|nr:hypothetical protein K2173_023808 [Erythroxylum novogranatense]